MSSSTNNGTRDVKIADDGATHGEPWEGKQIMLILCGLIASGKSTFAAQLQQHFPQFLRCSQDDLGSRRDVEGWVRYGLGIGMSVCIDRTNVNALQRSYWIEIAREFPGTLIWLIVFDVPYETCAARLRERTSHPTIKNAEQGLSVLARFAHEFEHPHPDEGHDRIIYLSESDHVGPIYSRSDISAILRRVWDSVPVTPTGIPGSLQIPQDYFHEGSRDLTR